MKDQMQITYITLSKSSPYVYISYQKESYVVTHKISAKFPQEGLIIKKCEIWIFLDQNAASILILILEAKEICSIQ